MIARYIIVFSIFWVSLYAQQYGGQRYNGYNTYYENTHNSINSKGVCTINGEVFYGIDCWCYSNKIGAVFFTIIIVFLVIFFFLTGCVWACLIHCYRSFCGRRDEDDILDSSSIRSSMRRY